MDSSDHRGDDTMMWGNPYSNADETDGCKPDPPPKKKRPTWEEYFLKFAKDASERSVCERSKCGAVIVIEEPGTKNNKGRMISTGYNGAPAHQPNCADIGYCYRNKNNIKSGTQLEKCRAAGCHAENNAIANAARYGGGCDGATMYIYGNTNVCIACRGQIANSGIKKVVYNDKFGNIKRIDVAKEWTVHPIDKMDDAKDHDMSERS
jgi:dCMP deaminase